MKVTPNKMITALSSLALQLEKEINDNPSDNLIYVGRRSIAGSTLSIVRHVISDDWLVTALASKLNEE